MRFKPSEALRFLAGLGIAALVGLLIVFRVTSCAPPPPQNNLPMVGKLQPALPPPAPVAPAIATGDCTRGPAAAAALNASSLTTLAWAPFKRPETGWATYAPLIAREIGTGCAPESPGFARAFAAWEKGQERPADGVLTADDFKWMKGIIESRRPLVLLAAQKICADPADAAALPFNRPGEGYGGKQIQLRAGAWDAYRRMVADARRTPEIAADPRNLTIFSGFRAPEADAARCLADGNCDGVVRAVSCSPPRTRLALALYVGQAPGFGPDSSAEPNRRFMSQTPTYRWLVANADRYGFAPYPFEPWHWEWTGEAP